MQHAQPEYDPLGNAVEECAVQPVAPRSDLRLCIFRSTPEPAPKLCVDCKHFKLDDGVAAGRADW